MNKDFDDGAPMRSEKTRRERDPRTPEIKSQEENQEDIQVELNKLTDFTIRLMKKQEGSPLRDLIKVLGEDLERGYRWLGAADLVLDLAKIVADCNQPVPQNDIESPSTNGGQSSLRCMAGPVTLRVADFAYDTFVPINVRIGIEVAFSPTLAHAPEVPLAGPQLKPVEREFAPRRQLP